MLPQQALSYGQAMTDTAEQQVMTEDYLQKEVATYNAKLPELIGSIGKFVLIKGDRVEGIYDTYADALKVGYERFKLSPFMVKQIGFRSTWGWII
jgi:hypothetical protein